MKRRFIAPSNLQFFISGADLPAGEYFGDDARIVSNGRVVTIPCQYEMEGDTELIIGQLDEVPKDGVLAFEGLVTTPGRVLVASDVALKHLMDYPVASETTHLTIWTDGQQLPARVVIGVK